MEVVKKPNPLNWKGLNIFRLLWQGSKVFFHIIWKRWKKKIRSNGNMAGIGIQFLFLLATMKNNYFRNLPLSRLKLFKFLPPEIKL